MATTPSRAIGGTATLLLAALAVTGACSSEPEDAQKAAAHAGSAGSLPGTAGGGGSAGSAGAATAGSAGKMSGAGMAGTSSSSMGGSGGSGGSRGGAGGTGNTGGAGRGTGGGGKGGDNGAGSIGKGGRAGAGGSAGGGAAQSGSAGAAGDVGSGGASPSDGCASGSKPARGHYTITVGSVERGYYLVPSATDAPVPLVFEFHGRGGDGEGTISSFGLETSLGGNVVLVAPDGLDQGGGTGWSNGNDGVDIALTRALVDQAKKDHCIDATRIFAVGFSWGGWMATQAACALGPTLAGFVSVEGGGPMGGSCAGPVAGMVVHGTADTAEPISSGIATRDKFRTLDGCGDMLGSSTVDGCQEYAGCTTPLLWCQHDGAHEIPGFVPAGLPTFFDLAR